MTRPAVVQSAPLRRCDTIALGMAQLAPHGISEDWWLKHLGDVHWQLIADAVGQNTTVFRDTNGRQLYAAFCATEFCQLQPDLVELGKLLEIHSELWAVGRSRIQSTHRLVMNDEEVAQFKLVSTFVAHMQAGVNASVRRAAPYLIPVLEPAPDNFAQCASAQAKAQQKRARQNASQFVPLTPHVGTDFNAVGLLYFPSFTRLFEHTEAVVSENVSWSAIKNRKVLYFRNIEKGEVVSGSASVNGNKCFELWTANHHPAQNSLLASCSLSRF